MIMDDVRLSKFLSLVLRHEPQKIGIRLDKGGWVEVKRLLAACKCHGVPLTRERLEHVVVSSDKQRFAFDRFRIRIRANQGHSVPVELGYERKVPPEFLFHGTTEKFLSSIRLEGLRKGKRHHVHLSSDEATARKVGERRGRPVVLTVRAGDMYRVGHQFFFSANGVWLVESVPPIFLNPES